VCISINIIYVSACYYSTLPNNTFPCVVDTPAVSVSLTPESASSGGVTMTEGSNVYTVLYGHAFGLICNSSSNVEVMWLTEDGTQGIVHVVVNMLWLSLFSWGEVIWYGTSVWLLLPVVLVSQVPVKSCAPDSELQYQCSSPSPNWNTELWW